MLRDLLVSVQLIEHDLESPAAGFKGGFILLKLLAGRILPEYYLYVFVLGYFLGLFIIKSSCSPFSFLINPQKILLPY